MSDYKDIKGLKVQYVSSDPANPIEGQLWYNSTSEVLKARILRPVGSWSSGGDINTLRNFAAGFGTQTSGIMAGGQPPIGGLVESYNGTSWTEVGDLNTARSRAGGAGPDNTSGLVYGGFTDTGTTPEEFTGNEEWNGTSWTEVGDLNNARRDFASGGSPNSAFAACGQGFPAPIGNYEEWNGTSWSNNGTLTNALRGRKGVGANFDAVLVFGGQPTTGATESYNGGSWTEVNDLNTGRYDMGQAGEQTAALTFGGSGAPDLTESWNGTSWTEVAPVSSGNAGLTGAGTQTAALKSGSTLSVTSEEWNTSPSVTTIPISTV